MSGVLHLDLNLRASTLERIEISAAQFMDLFRHRLSWRYFGLSLTILLATDPAELTGTLSLPVYVATWVGAFGLYLAHQTALILLLASLRRLFPTPAFYWPFLTIGAFVPTLVVVENVLDAFSNAQASAIVIGRVAYIALTVLVLETIYQRFVLPRILEQSEQPAAGSGGPEMETSQQDARVLHVGGATLAFDEISVIEAREHHVHLRTTDGTQVHRARLSDIVAQTCPDDGLQPHRSWWVSRSSVRELGREDGKPVLWLTDGTSVPVARGRLEDVRDWVERYLG
ncbi:MAG: LytTR family transcriptional regulator [Rhodobacteraceae bacterium]|uniref:Response regulator of the LytR/AlgR family n=1 Tax=Salipiger profundus TaxID=1229727 RepID=A0A1U7DAW1_9RHOB|nr:MULTISPECIES: LytTR family DNA-binding domain-containing protein [Salipiger]APX25200.1 response regulator of the LytR/AlgR family [Salipiger profundus]MAB05538.1 LytTR family transcriptional regulator [Paracoccaceae bacterium]GGA16043.1 hypothetical protein GCM10011326_30710 [Salipiger profundus]